MVQKGVTSVKLAMEKLEHLLELGGTKKDITLLVISGIALIVSIFDLVPLPFDASWAAIILCGIPIILEAVIGLVTAFDIKADVLVSLALIASVCIGEDFAAGEVAFIMQLGGLLEELTVARARAGIEKLVHLTPQTARVILGGEETAVPAEDVKVGDLLPSEAELCRSYDISRNTVRQAIGALEEEGFVVRKRGKGTFVTDPNTRRKGVQYSFTTEISQLGKTPSSTLVDFAVITPSPKIVTLMGLEQGVKVYRFTRVRNVDGEPLILETSYYPEYIYPNLTRELLETHSFYSLLYHVGVIPFSASDTYEAVVLAPHEAQLLHCAPGSAAFFHQRRTTTENGHTYEYTTSYMRADRVKLDVRFQKGSTSFMRTVD